jgi:hypothetical protein
MNRIYIYVALAFVASFAGVSWAARGFPVSIGSQRIALTIPDQGAKNAARGAPGDKGPSLDTIKLEALQAATGFALSPCDSTMKQNLVEAMTAYVHAWQVKLDCPRVANIPICGEEKLKAAVVAFSTPLDRRLAVAVAQAFSQPGITIADFSETIRYDMLRFGGPALRPGYSPVCEPGLRTSTLTPRRLTRSVNR